MDPSGKLLQKRLGNEKDIRIISDANLGTSSGLKNSMLHNSDHSKLTLTSFGEKYIQKSVYKSANEKSPKPGFYNKNQTCLLPSTKNSTNHENKFRQEHTFSTPIEYDHEELINLLQRERRISSSEE